MQQKNIPTLLPTAVLLEGDMDDTTPATTPTPSQTPMTADSLTQEQLLAIVIPVAAGSVLVVLVIVVIGVILCAKIHKNARMRYVIIQIYYHESFVKAITLSTQIPKTQF